MLIPKFRSFLFLLCAPVCWSVHNLRYAHLEEMTAACPPRDTCVEGSNSFITSNCECDDQCQLFDDCCIDAQQTSTSAEPFSNLNCIANGTGSYVGAYAVSRCKEDWVGSMVLRRNCESITNMSDPLLAAPTTDVDARVTYKNAYCAECNDANLPVLQSWVTSVNCKSLKAVNDTGGISRAFIVDNLSYKSTYPHRNKWGVYYKADDRRETFYPCDVTFFIPRSLVPSVRLCRPNLVSTCPANWRGKKIRENCEAFLATVYTDTRSYRNVHCAHCNNVTISDISCTSGVLMRKSGGPANFAIIMDGNLNNGSEVGEIQRCRTGQKYDTFYKRCRSRGCALEGYVLVGKKCVRQ